MMGRAIRAVARTTFAVLAIGALAPAVAGADAEPNNAVFAPEGPIVGGQDVAGTVSHADPDDWYLVYVEGVHQLHLTSPQGTTGYCPWITLTNSDGTPIPSDYTSPSGTTAYFVHVSRPLFANCPGELSYSFRVDPAVGVVAGPGKLPVKGIREPNETLDDAGGPLAPGAWYVSRLDTANDHDWLHFYARPGAGRVDVQAVTLGTPACTDPHLFLTNARGDEVASGAQTPGAIGHLTYDAGRGAKLFLHSMGSRAGCVGASVVWQVGPKEAVMTRAEVRATCSKGRGDVRRWTRRVAADKRAIARADGAPSRAQRRKLAGDRRKLKAARRLVVVYC
jgi:hypothetical protein